MPPVGMSAPDKAHRLLNLVEITSKNKIEIVSVFSIWVLVSQKCVHLAVETELLLLHFAGGLLRRIALHVLLSLGAAQLTGLMTDRISWSGFENWLTKSLD
jgi:hypothetical protein